MPLKNIAEEGAKQVKRVDKPHDKLFKQLLRNKEEFIFFLQKYVGVKETFSKEEIEIYTMQYCNVKYETREADLVYRIKGKQIFFLLEHQTKTDKNMPYRMLEYAQIMAMQILEQEKEKIQYYPTVIGIVLYTGNEKWTAKTNIKDLQDTVKGCEELQLNYGYCLVDSNQYSKEKLLQEDSILTKAMAIETCKTKEEAKKLLQEIIKNTPKHKKKQIYFLIEYVLKNLLEEEINWKKIWEEEKELDTMLAENIKEENRRIRKEGKIEGKKEGKREGILEVIQKMVKMQLDTNIIEEATGVSKEEIGKIRRKCKI